MKTTLSKRKYRNTIKGRKHEKEYAKEYRQKNKERIKQRGAEYRKKRKNKERKRAYMKKYRQTKKFKQAYKNKYYKNQRLKYKIISKTLEYKKRSKLYKIKYWKTKKFKIAWKKYAQKYTQIEKNKENLRKGSKKYRARKDVKKKQACRFKTYYLVQQGKIDKKSCEVCGKKKVQAHHPDYSRPELVVWLCVKHHKELHKKHLI